MLSEIDAEAAAVAGFGFRGAWILEQAAAAAGELGEIARAEELRIRAAALWAGRDVYYQSRAARWLDGTIAWNRGDLTPAIELAREGADRLLAMGALPIAALALRDLADMLREAGEERAAAGAEASLQTTVKGLDSPFLRSLAEFAAPATADLLGRLGYLRLHARSLAAGGHLAEAAAAFGKLGASRQGDRVRAELARSGQAPPSPAATALKRSLLFDSVDAADLEWLAGAAARGTYRAGDEVHRRNGPAREVGVVEVGSVRLGFSTLDGPRLLGQVGPGELLGERAVIGGETHSLDAEAITATSVIWLPPAALLGFLRSRPAIAERLLTLLSQRLRQEAAVTGEPEPADVAARVLGRLPRPRAMRPGLPPSRSSRSAWSRVPFSSCVPSDPRPGRWIPRLVVRRASWSARPWRRSGSVRRSSTRPPGGRSKAAWCSPTWRCSPSGVPLPASKRFPSPGPTSPGAEHMERRQRST